MKSPELTRRGMLGLALATSGALVFPASALAAPANGTTPWNGSTSANGWPVLTTTPTFRIEGSNESTNLADGDSATVLLYVARRFNYEVDSLRSGDVTAHTTDRNVAQPYESNYLSGTAIAIRPLLYPVGAGGMFYPNELAVIKDILAELKGVVAWGGDASTPKESHFEIAVRPGDSKLKDAAAKIRGWDEQPSSEGAGATDAFNR
ncbi:MAG: hypothetical protein L0G87_03625 [Renibacterium salmoninarum]|nr:hypothetical protein [Renibacterium salmoninarum]